MTRVIQPVEDMVIEFLDMMANDDPQLMMLYGETGAGKTYRYLEILNAVHKLDEYARFWIIDTDQAIKQNIQAKKFADLRKSGRIHAQYIRKWINHPKLTKQPVDGVTLQAFTEYILANCRRRDWIVVDRASLLWKNLCADAACVSKLGKTVEQIEREYQFTESGKIKGGNALLQYYTSVINPFWREWEERILYSGANVIFICSDQELRVGGEERGKISIKDKHELVAQFEKVGIRPAIQGDTPFKFHTVMAVLQPYHKDYRVTTCRERGDKGEPYFREKVVDLGEDYIKGRCGYQPPELSEEEVEFWYPQE